MSDKKRKPRLGFSRVAVVSQTIRQAYRSLGENRLGALRPVFLALLLIAVFLYLLHVVSPLAPFVYSLF